MVQLQKRVSPLREWLILTGQSAMILFYDVPNLLISLAFPIAAAAITVWIAGENLFVHYEGTKSACFVLTSAAIWGGLFNSIQIVVRERANIRRDHAAGLRLRCYTAAKAVVQFVLCLMQSLLLACAFPVAVRCYDTAMPAEGILSELPLLEYYISLFLLMYAADAMGIAISCIVRKPETANVAAPYILILQLIFSGVLFSMKGATEILSYVMLSRWGMEALGSISNLNAMALRIHSTVPNVPHEAEDMFLSSPAHLLRVWGVLALFAVVFLVVGNLALHRVAKDTR